MAETTKETKARDLRFKTDRELADQLLLLRKEQFNLRFQRAAAPLEKTARMRVVRRDIARIMTVLGERARDGAGTQKIA